MEITIKLVFYIELRYIYTVYLLFILCYSIYVATTTRINHATFYSGATSDLYFLIKYGYLLLK